MYFTVLEYAMSFEKITLITTNTHNYGFPSDFKIKRSSLSIIIWTNNITRPNNKVGFKNKT